VRRGPEEQPVDDAEHDRVGADRERERENDGGGKARAAAESPEGIPYVLPHDVPDLGATRLGHLLAIDCA
jgi:hypothetical protein